MGVRSSFLAQVDTLQRAIRISDRQLSIQATGNPQHLLMVRRGDSVTLRTIERIEQELDRLAVEAGVLLEAHAAGNGQGESHGEKS